MTAMWLSENQVRPRQLCRNPVVKVWRKVFYSTGCNRSQCARFHSPVNESGRSEYWARKSPFKIQSTPLGTLDVNVLNDSRGRLTWLKSLVASWVNTLSVMWGVVQDEGQIFKERVKEVFVAFLRRDENYTYECVGWRSGRKVRRHFPRMKGQNEVRVKTLLYPPTLNPSFFFSTPSVYEYFCITAPVTVATLSNQLFTLPFLPVKLLSALKRRSKFGAALFKMSQEEAAVFWMKPPRDLKDSALLNTSYRFKNFSSFFAEPKTTLNRHSFPPGATCGILCSFFEIHVRFLLFAPRRPPLTLSSVLSRV